MTVTRWGAGLRRWLVSPDALMYAVVAAVVVALALSFWGFSLGSDAIPFTYRSDGLLHSLSFKAITDTGQATVIERLGAPGSLVTLDFPGADALFTAEVWVITRFVRDWAVALNLFALLTYPLIGLTAAWALRRMGFRRSTSAVFAMLYAFLPYHQARLPVHLYLSAYFAVPLVIALACELLREGSGPEDAAGEEAASKPSRRVLGVPVWALPVVIILGMTGVYYAFFGAIVILFAGLVSAYRSRRLAASFGALACAAIVAITAAVQVIPNIAFEREHGRSELVSARQPFEADVYGLRLILTGLPAAGHRVDRLAEAREQYRQDMESFGWDFSQAETDSALGVTGFVGLLLLLLWMATGAVRPPPGPIAVRLAVLAAAVVFLGTVGGVGEMLAYAVIPQIRVYARIVVFLGFLALSAVAVLVERGTAAASGHGGGASLRRPALRYLALALLLAFGLWDQTAPSVVPDRAIIRAQWDSDRAYVRDMERALPAGAAVFQLPYIAFPEGATTEQTEPYDPLRLYLASTDLRFSFGAFRGRDADQWQERVSALRVPGMLKALEEEGFAGLSIDRDGYEDGAARLETQVSEAMGGTEPLVSPDGRYAFFPLG